MNDLIDALARVLAARALRDAARELQTGGHEYWTPREDVALEHAMTRFEVEFRSAVRTAVRTPHE